MNPKGPADSFDPNEPGYSSECTAGIALYRSVLAAIRPVGRGKGEMDTGTNHSSVFDACDPALARG